jgi:hypothetical protein
VSWRNKRNGIVHAHARLGFSEHRPNYTACSTVKLWETEGPGHHDLRSDFESCYREVGDRLCAKCVQTVTAAAEWRLDWLNGPGT